MKRAFRDKLVEALKSGDYKYASGELRSSATDCYCINGVAAVIGGYNVIGGHAIEGFECGDYDSLLPPEVAEKLGIPPYMQNRIAEANDCCSARFGRPFPQELIDFAANLPVED